MTRFNWKRILSRAIAACALTAAIWPTSVFGETIFFGTRHQVDGPFDADLDMSLGTIGVSAASGTDWVSRNVPFYSEGNAAILHGIAITGATAPQGFPDFGPGVDNDQFELLFANGRHFGPRVTAPVTVGHTYKIQLLTSEHSYAAGGNGRGFDIYIEGAQAADEMPVWLGDGNHQVAFAHPSATLYTHTYTATDPSLDVFLDFATTFTDSNPYFQGFTIRDLTPTLSTPAVIGTFTGGDAGEGLDLDGSFPYAVNIRGPGGFSVRNANFTDDAAPGVTVVAENEILFWHGPNYGATADDDNLETVMQSIRWTDTASGGTQTLDVNLANLVEGQSYKLQLLFAESCCDRAFDVVVEDTLLADDFNPGQVQGFINNTAAGAVITWEFTARDSTLNIVLNGFNIASGSPDHNPILNGLTLEELPVPEPATFALLASGLVAVVVARRRRR